MADGGKKADQTRPNVGRANIMGLHKSHFIHERRQGMKVFKALILYAFISLPQEKSAPALRGLNA